MDEADAASLNAVPGNGKPSPVALPEEASANDRPSVLDALRAAALAVSSAEGDQLHRELMRCLATILAVDAAFIAVHVDAARTHMKTLACWLDGRFLRNFEYPLQGSPCAAVVGREFRFVPRGVLPEFTPGTIFHALRMDSYAAIPLSDARGAPLGLIAVMDRHPMPDAPLAESILKIFAARAAAEIERKRAVDALSDSEASYRAIFEASEDAIFVHDWDTDAILDVSPKAEAIYGYPADVLRRMSVAEVTADDPRFTEAEARRRIAEAKSGRAVEFEWLARHRDGRTMWHEVRLKRATIAGKPRVLAFVRDITERKLAEDALRMSEEQYRAIFNASADALVLWNSQSRRVDVNPAYERMYGYTREEIVGDADIRQLPTELEERRREIVRRTLAGERCHVELDSVRRNGEPLQIEVRTIPIRHRGEPHVLAIVRDVTERKRAEAAVRASEKRYRLLFEMESDAILVTDAATLDLLDANRAAEELWGYDREELLRLKATDLSAEPAATRAALQGETGTLAVPMRWHRKKDGTMFPVEITLNRFELDGRKIVLSAIRDVTERKAAEARRSELEAQLRQAQKMEALGQLTGGIAHDFNNLLASIMGYIALASEQPAVEDDPRLLRYMDQAYRSCERARDLIQQMLAFSRGRKRSPRALSLPSVVADSLGLFQGSIPPNIDVRTALAPDVPHVLIDPVQFEQVLMNLAINARDAMPTGGTMTVSVQRVAGTGRACASCHGRVEDEFVELAVADTGGGIPPGVQERMFEPFFTTKEVGRGTGMGLATVHAIVHDHGGHIVVDSDSRAGTCFRVLLPPSRDRAPGPSEGEPRRTRTVLPPLNGRVIVVDDERAVGSFMQDLLSSWSLDVTVFDAPGEALERLAQDSGEFDVLLTDQTMPGMSGLDLARAAALLRPALPVLIYSGHHDAIVEAAKGVPQVRATLAKPIDPATLHAALASALARRAERHQA